MTEEMIDQLFQKAISAYGINKKLDGVSSDMLYDWRKNRVIPTIGVKLGVLYQLNLIKISVNESA